MLHSPTILLIDNSLETRDLLMHYGEERGYIIKHSLPDALISSLEQYAIDILLIDIDMYCANCSILRWLASHSLYRSIPVIIISNNRDPTTIKESFLAKIYNYLFKPVDLHTIKATLEPIIVTKKSSQEKTVIVITNNTLLLEALNYSLMIRYINCITYASHTSLLPQLRNKLLTPNMVILDSDVDANPISIIYHLKALIDKTEILFLSSFSKEEDLMAALAAGAFRCVAKPFAMPLLIKTIEISLNA